MTVGELEQRLKYYPRETKVLILASTNGPQGINILPELMATYVRPDVETVPSSVFLVPEHELVKA